MAGKDAVRTYIGTIDGKKLRFLGHIQACDPDNCPLAKNCGFQSPGNQCKVIYNYLASLYRDWVAPGTGLGEELNQIQIDRIGSHLMPLYHQLARFCLEAAALPSMTYFNKGGTEMAHPHFAEIRAALKEIRAELKELKLEKMWNDKFRSSLPGTNVNDIMQKGQIGAYEKMVERARNLEKKGK